MSTLLIQHTTVVTVNDAREVLPETSILIEDGRIATLIPPGQPLPEVGRTINGRGMVAMPGLVNAHTHAAMTLLRGYADDMELMPWLQEKIWPTEEKLQEADVYWGTMLAIAEMIRSGVTCFADMYFFPEAAVKACRETGIRACISGVLLGIRPNANEALRKAVRFSQELQQHPQGHIVPLLAPHAPYTCPDALMRDVIAASRETGIGLHIHLSETRREVEDSLAQFGETPIAHMNTLGMFDGPPVLAAHCVWATEEDIGIMAEKKVGVAHNPGSNMKLASGAAPIAQMLAAGVHVGLGTDGAASNNNLDVLEEARLAALLAKLATGDPTAVRASEALYMATRGGAEALGLGHTIGQISPEYRADIILLDTRRPHLQPLHDVVSQLIYAARADDIRTVLVDGTPLMIDGVLQTVDEETIIAEANSCARRLTKIS